MPSVVSDCTTTKHCQHPTRCCTCNCVDEVTRTEPRLEACDHLGLCNLQFLDRVDLFLQAKSAQYSHVLAVLSGVIPRGWI